MAAVSAPQASSALTPPSSSHGGQTSWSYSVPAQTENSSQSKMNDFSNRPPLTHMNGHSIGHQSSRPDVFQKRADTYSSSRSADSGYLAPARINALVRKDSNISDAGSAPDSLLDLYGPNSSGINNGDYVDTKTPSGEIYDNDDDPEHSRWIHRDKLARIESQELQAAGIVLPRARATSKSSRREHSRDRQGNGLRSEQGGQKRPRIGSFPTEAETPEINDWDLRLPEEAAEDQGDLYQDVSGGVKGISRIPVCKSSPIPIPFEHLERDTPMRRKQSGGWMGEDEPSSYPKSKVESDSVKMEENAATPTPAKRPTPELSPVKKASARKGSTSAARTTPAQKPKIKANANRETSGQRPKSRSSELGPSNSVKRPEGDPPWLATMYKPDPRLPPDQQLLPTVAKRLQQEQWEKEGKFGNVYDTSFRPLNDEEYHPPPEPVSQMVEVEEEKKASEEHGSEWPLRGPKSPANPGSPARLLTPGGGYSTMPRIMGTPEGVSLPSPRSAPMRFQEPPEEAKRNGGGCACCVVM